MTRPRIFADVRTAGEHDAHLIVDVLTEAFFGGDLAGWLVADEQVRRPMYRQYFAMLTDDALQHGHVDITVDGRGVALWYVRDGRPVPVIPDYRRRLEEIFGFWVDGFHALDEATDEHHPKGPPHHYLQHLAVHPDVQRCGHGTRLLRHHHRRRVDKQGMPSYLEATGFRNQALYWRHGYRPREPFTLGPDGPPLLPMWRLPAGHASTGGEA